MSADRELLDDIIYEDPFGNTHRQQVQYEWRPQRCVNCLNFGHVQVKCPEKSLDELFNAMKEKEAEYQAKLVCKALLAVEDAVGAVRERERDKRAYESGESSSKGESKEVKMRVFKNDEVVVVPETQEVLVESSESSESIESVDSEEQPIGERFKQYVSKSAAKRAKHKEKKTLGRDDKETGKEKVSDSKGNKGEPKGLEVQGRGNKKEVKRGGKNKFTKFTFNG